MNPARALAALTLLLAVTGCAADPHITKGVVVDKTYIPAPTTNAPMWIGTGWTPPSEGATRDRRCWRIDVKQTDTNTITPYCVTVTEFDAVNIGDPYTRITIAT